jgi:hypothetical protein
LQEYTFPAPRRVRLGQFQEAPLILHVSHESRTLALKRFTFRNPSELKDLSHLDPLEHRWAWLWKERKLNYYLGWIDYSADYLDCAGLGTPVREEPTYAMAKNVFCDSRANKSYIEIRDVLFSRQGLACVKHVDIRIHSLGGTRNSTEVEEHIRADKARTIDIIEALRANILACGKRKSPAFPLDICRRSFEDICHGGCLG